MLPASARGVPSRSNAETGKRQKDVRQKNLTDAAPFAMQAASIAQFGASSAMINAA
jgi:hypothetical protein